MFATPRRLRLSFFPALLLAGASLLPAGDAWAATRAELDDLSQRAGIVFREMRAAPDAKIPGDLLARSRCVAVVPNVIKAAWVVGGRYGQGLLSCRSKTGEWSPPIVVTMTGGSFGFQAGVSSTDVVLFFMTTESVHSLLRSKVQLSGDAGVAAGPVGREAVAGTDGRFTAQIYSYARSRGLFAGVSLSGGYLGMSEDDTRTYYGRGYTANNILFEQKVTNIPKSTWYFLAALPRPRATTASKTPAKPAPSKSARKAPAKPSRPAASTTKPAPAAPAKAPEAAADVASGPDAIPGGDASGSAAFGGEASGSAAFGDAASGTAAESGDASGSAAYGGEASGTAATLEEQLPPSPAPAP
ncbi:MAG: YSC84-related protein [Candidatus Binatia bacterium]